nr:FtsW/RodA/SpoVE family cell cycle protein [Corynebacterium auriscanis]
MTQSLPRRASNRRLTRDRAQRAPENRGSQAPRREDQPSKATTKGLARLATPQLNYLVIMAVTGILTAVGLTMVLSSSMVTSYARGSSVWAEFIKQAIVVVIGLIAMRFALQLRPATIRRLAPWMMVLSIGLLVAVLIPGVGVGGDEVGSNSWIRIGPLGIQPLRWRSWPWPCGVHRYCRYPNGPAMIDKRFPLFWLVRASFWGWCCGKKTWE